MSAHVYTLSCLNNNFAPPSNKGEWRGAFYKVAIRARLDGHACLSALG